jgi:hypothetical protein
MSRLLGRVLALERRRKAPPATDAPRLPPGFWDALAGAVPPEQLPAETRAALAPLFGRSACTDPVAERIGREMAKRGGSHDGTQGR